MRVSTVLSKAARCWTSAAWIFNRSLMVAREVVCADVGVDPVVPALPDDAGASVTDALGAAGVEEDGTPCAGVTEADVTDLATAAV